MMKQNVQLWLAGAYLEAEKTDSYSNTHPLLQDGDVSS